MGLDFFRQADWLDAARGRGYLLLLALLNIAMPVFLIATSHNGVDRNGYLIGTDFLSFWTTGHMLQAHQDVYDVAAHTAAQRAFFAREGVHTAFFYPPPFLHFCYPLGYLGYFPALAAWLLTTGAIYVLAVRLWARKRGMTLPLWTAIMGFPPVLITVTHGQTSFLVSALLGAGALLVCDRPWLGGFLLGLVAVKPQFGLLVPLVLVLTGQWRAIAAAVVAVVTLGLAAMLYGTDVWPHWVAVTRAAQAAMAEGAVPFAKMQSLFAAARLLGAPANVAYALQGTLSLGVAAAVGWAGWRRSYDAGLAALMLTGALLVTPFMLDYDMVLLAFPLIWVAAQGFRPWEKLICALTFIAPAFARPLGLEAGIPITPFILIAFFVILLRRLVEHKSPRADRVAAGAGSTLA
jgi:hypothetical protein